MSPQIPFPAQANPRLRPAWYRLQRYVASLSGKVLATATDTTLGYLVDKIIAGTGIDVVPVGPPGNEQLRLDATGGTSDEQVKVTLADTTPGYLDGKIVPGSGLVRTILSPLANEQWRVDVVANADGSITVNADDVQVGVLATDAQHGNRGGGGIHAVATTLVAGFMSAGDKSNLDGLVSSAVPSTRSLTAGAGMTGGGTLAADRTFNVVANPDGSITVNADDVQVGVLATDAQHGNRGGGGIHALATTSVAGFMSGADKTKLNALPSGGFVAPIDTLVNLAALPAASLPDGTQIYCNEVEDIYVLEKAGAHVVDGLCVLSATGGGYWVARHAGRWDDLRGDISQGVGASALTFEDWIGTPPVGYPAHKQYYFRSNQNDELSFEYQFSHEWLPGTSAYPHLHCTPAANPAVPEVINLNGIYVWTRGGLATPALNVWTPFSVQHTVNPGDVFIPTIIGFGAFAPPVGMKESCILKIAIRRTIAAPDTYKTAKTWGTGAANLALDSADVHYRKQKLGTEEQFPP